MVQITDREKLQELIGELKHEIRRDRLVRGAISVISIASISVSAFVCVQTNNILQILISIALGIMVSIDFVKYLEVSIKNTKEYKSIIKDAKELIKNINENMDVMGE